MAGTSAFSPTPAADDRRRLVAIGNFDGVHLGHQRLVQAVVREGCDTGLVPAVMTFDPHPSEVLGRGALPRLTRLERKLTLLRQQSSALEVLVHRFDRNVAQMSPEDFVRQLLVQRYRAGRVIVGANFRFGRGRAGTLEVLSALGAELGFSAAALPLLETSGTAISSSRIRQLIATGDVASAAALLGRCHETRGSVTTGAAMGRGLGFPTANLTAVEEMLPASGVYACRARVVGERAFAPAVANIGVRPTVTSDTSHREPVAEVHLIDQSVDIYGRLLDVQWVQHLRSERRFESLDALRQQIATDVGQARRILAAAGYDDAP